MADLHIYELADGALVVARTPTDAWRIWADHTGDTRKDRGFRFADCSRLPPERLLELDLGADRFVARPCAEWAASNGRGWLADAP